MKILRNYVANNASAKQKILDFCFSKPDTNQLIDIEEFFVEVKKIFIFQTIMIEKY